MNEVILLIAMLFFHLLDDYNLQGILADFKQKSWWEKNYPDELYKNDYKMALKEHAFSWTVMIHIPLTVYIYATGYYDLKDISFIAIYIFIFIVNYITHTFVDNLKANDKLINLCVDQTCHFIQIILTWIVYLCLGAK